MINDVHDGLVCVQINLTCAEWKGLHRLMSTGLPSQSHTVKQLKTRATLPKIQVSQTSIIIDSNLERNTANTIG